MAYSGKLSEKEIATDKAERILNGIGTWCSFYRANPHRFCKDYLNINLKLFQKILIVMMNISNFFIYIASIWGCPVEILGENLSNSYI